MLEFDHFVIPYLGIYSIENDVFLVHGCKDLMHYVIVAICPVFHANIRTARSYDLASFKSHGGGGRRSDGYI